MSAERDGAEAAPVGGLRLRAPAKVNLALEVLGRRPDGYHDLDTVLTTVDLADEVRIWPHATLELSLEGPRAAAVVEAMGELGARAALALAQAAGREPAARIAITKRVPVAAGLGGGSSDAAAVLRGLNVLWGLDWPLERLTALAAALGSDVPFFLHGGTARCTGRGERVEPLRDIKPPLRLLLLVPPMSLAPGKTARRFGALTRADFSSGERARRLAHRLARGAPPPTRDLVNAFERVVERTDSELVAHYAAYHAAGAPHMHLTGTGPALYVFVREDARISELRRDFESVGADVFDVRTLPRAAALETAPLAPGA